MLEDSFGMMDIYTLLERAMNKHGQVFLMVRDMETDENNPTQQTQW